MLFVLIALWIVALLIWLTDPKSRLHQRLGAIAFAGGTGALAAVIDLQWLPQAEQSGMHNIGIQLLEQLQAVASVFSYYAVPFFYLWFCLTYNPMIKWKSGQMQRLLPVFLILPIAVCLMTTPAYTEQIPIAYEVVIWWAVPYIAAGTILLLSKQSFMRDRTHLLLCLTLIPPVLFSMVMNYVLPCFGYYRMWRFNTWAIAAAVTIFIIALFTYGFMGARVLILRRRYDSTLRAVTSGTAILNHAIKNDAGKLRLFSEKMKSYAISTGQEELLADVETVLAASRHMQDMVQRIHKRTEEVVLKPQRTELAALIYGVVNSFKPSLGEVTYSVDCSTGWTAMIDSVHMSETLSNLIANALEAMKGKGHLSVKLLEQKRLLIIEVGDNGPGMSKRLARKVFEPFYTTKNGGSNFGLGLSYCYSVMKGHKGELLLRTAPEQGSVFSMVLDKRKTAAELMPEAQLERGEAYDEHKSMAN